MIPVLNNHPLIELNTLRVSVTAKAYVPIASQEALIEYIESGDLEKMPYMVLGGGSNILFLKNYYGTILHPLMKGIDIIEESSNHLIFSVKAGENWDQFVAHTVNKGVGGIENLSGIPGSVGAAPIQNIGAYGVEVKDTIHSVETFNLKTRKIEIFQNDACQFEYRTSIFKTSLNESHMVTSVNFKLNKNPEFILNYGAVKKKVAKMGKANLHRIRQAILSIRAKKLPDPKDLPNAGSFFKNPIIEKSHFDTLLEKYPWLVSYPLSENEVKIPAAWLIENAGYKGKRRGDVGTHKDHALVIVNYNSAEGWEIYQFSEKIIEVVRQKFDISLEREVSVI